MFKLGVVIQGSMNGFADQVDMWTNLTWPNDVVAIISTWKDSICSELVQRFQQAGYVVLLSDPPEWSGRANLNYQTKSTARGIQEAKARECTHIFKTRSDYVPAEGSNLAKALEAIWSEHKDPAHYVLCQYNSHSATPWYCDFIYFGAIEDAFTFWNVTQNKDDAREPEHYLEAQVKQALPQIPFRTMLWQLHHHQVEFYRLKWRENNYAEAYRNIAGHVKWTTNGYNDVYADILK